MLLDWISVLVLLIRIGVRGIIGWAKRSSIKRYLRGAFNNGASFNGLFCIAELKDNNRACLLLGGV